jgi:N-methylhydantoinase B
MGVALRRTAYSEAVREGEDFSTAIFDAQGRLVAQGDFSPGHLGSMPFAVKTVAMEFPAHTLRPGDAILQNDPQIGSGHLPDFFLFYPVFYKETLVGWVVNCAHQADVGGAGLGSQVAEKLIDYYQEGLRIPPIKLYQEGRLQEEMLKLILGNVRLPDKVQGDMKAQLNSCRVGAARFTALLDLYGIDTIQACMEEMMDRSEAAIRAGLRAIPDGTYTFVDYLDDCGRETEPVEVRVAVTIAGDEAVVDFTGSSAQRQCGMNVYYNYTYAYVMCAMRAVTDPFVPQNEGCTRAVKLVVPKGCFFNAEPPAAAGARHITCSRIYEAVMGALAPAVPDKVFAATSHAANPFLGGLDPRTGRRFVMFELLTGGIGGRSNKDAMEAITSPWNGRNIPVEVQESHSPVLIERFEFVPDSGGAGRYRGGLALRRDIRILGQQVKLYNIAERQKFAPWGLFGGGPGALATTILNPGPKQEYLHSKGVYDLAPGDLLAMQVAGGGGYGDPLERDVQAVLTDVVKGYVSLEGARRDYGVVIDPQTMTVNEQETQALRARRKAGGGSE